MLNILCLDQKLHVKMNQKMTDVIKFDKSSKNKNMKRYYELKKQNKKGNMADIVTKIFLKEKRKRKVVKEGIFIEIFVTIKKKTERIW